MRPTRYSTTWLPTRHRRGLEAIQTKVKEYAGLNFKVVGTSAPIRQDNFVADFHRFGAPDATYPGLAVYELKDGKVLNQWVYPAP